MLLRVILDVNIFVSAYLSPQGNARQITKAADDGRFQIVASPELIDEVDEVLHRRRFHRYITQSEADQTVIDLRMTAEMHYPDEDPTPITRDPKDDYLVRLARTASVDYLVTGDKDLLEADAGIVVVSPADFVQNVLPKH